MGWRIILDIKLSPCECSNQDELVGRNYFKCSSKMMMKESAQIQSEMKKNDLSEDEVHIKNNLSPETFL